MNMKEFSRSNVEALSRFKQEPTWMRDLRLEAWDAFIQLGKKECADLALETLHAFIEPPQTAVPAHQWPLDLQHALDERGDEEGLIIQRDCTVLSRSISKEQAKRGVIFTDLDGAIKMVPEIVRNHFSRLAKPTTPLTALHTAFWSGGTFLYVPAHVEVRLPFHTCYWMSTPKAAIFAHTVIIAEKGSRVSLIGEFLSRDWTERALSCAAAEMTVGRKVAVALFDPNNQADAAVLAVWT